MKLIPEADYGTVFEHKNGKIVFINSKGHDLLLLKNIPIDESVFYISEKKVILVDNIDNLSTSKMNPENAEAFKKAVKPIKQTLTFSLYNREKKYIGISLDIGEKSKNSFKKESFQILTIFQKLAQFFLDFKLYSQKISESQQTMDFLAENINDIIFIQDLSFNFIYVSPNCSKLFGYTAEEIKKIPVENFFYGDSFHTAANDFRLLLDRYNRDQAIHIPLFEYQYCSKAGRPFWGELRTSFIKNEYNEPIFVIGVLRDITDRRKSIETMMQTQKMTSLGKLSGGIAHDFNNVLGIILGAAELTLKEIKNCSGEINKSEIEEYTMMIKEECLRSKDYVTRLLEFSRKKVLNLEVMDYKDLIDDTLKILQFSKKNKVVINRSLECDDPLISGDFPSLQNALLNVFFNAIDAMPNGGILSVNCKSIVLNENYCRNSPYSIEPGKFLSIEIKDTGSGIPRENMNKLFEPFFTTKQKGKGTGLGLPSVYGIVLEHKGEITIDSIENAGTTFTINLPLLKKDKLHTRKNSASRSIPRKNLTLNEEEETAYITKISKLIKNSGIRGFLIVDDKKGITAYFTKILSPFSIPVFTAVDSREAFRIFESSKDQINFLILDIIMPYMDGSELYAKISEISPGLPTIFISGYTENINILPYLEKENVRFISKPFLYRNILENIIDLLKKKG